MSIRPFMTLADRCGANSAEVERWVREGAERVRDEWLSLRSELPLPAEWADKIEKHWSTVPVLGARS